MKYLWELSRTKTKTLKLAFALSGPILFALWWRWIQQQGGERQLRPCYTCYIEEKATIFFPASEYDVDTDVTLRKWKIIK